MIAYYNYSPRYCSTDRTIDAALVVCSILLLILALYFASMPLFTAALVFFIILDMRD